MTSYFLDSSAIVKRYIVETGSAWIDTLTAPASGATMVLSEIALAEVAAALARAYRQGRFSQADRDNAVALFLGHCATEYELVPVSRVVIDRAVLLTQNYSLRGYDTVQLASALEADAVFRAACLARLTFVASDADLLAAAGPEGLTVDNPLLHP